VSEFQNQPARSGKARLANVGDVLGTVVQGLSLDRRLREHALRQIWPTLVGEPFQARSRVLFVDSEENVVVAVSDASTAQEMSFSKRELLQKIFPAARALGLRIRGIRFDLKQFFSKSESSLNLDPSQSGQMTHEPLPESPAEDELNRIALTESHRQQVQELTLALKSIDELKITSTSEDGSDTKQWSKRITRIVEHELKLETWRRSQNFPNCSSCHYPTGKLHTELGLCTQCYLKKLSVKG
jgi:hypothetical protein